MKKTTRVGKSLIAVQNELGTEEQALAFLEALRWPGGVTCLKCNGPVSKFTTRQSTRKTQYVSKVTGQATDHVIPARHLYQCLNEDCWFQFTATTGTIFNNTHLPLRKWTLAVAIMCNAKKGVSAKQLQRDLETSYKTAWFLAHRIREAMTLGNFCDEKMTGTIEIDETYIGGKFDKRRKRQRWDKEAVFGIIERETGRVHAKHLPGRSHLNRWQVAAEIDAVVDQSAHVMTDESRLYANLERRGFKHDIVIHSDKEWIRGECHTQSIDSFWALLKRGVVGSFHQISIKHLDRYIQEFSYRFNNKDNQELFGLTVAALVLGIPLPYKKLIASVPASEPETSDEPF
jgi:transposase-like protein